MTARRGRPPKSAMPLTREVILLAALKLVEETAGGLSLRGLAAILGVTPMALYPHIGDLDGLFQAMAEHCFVQERAQVDSSDESDLREHLIWYCERVLRHPCLATAIVARQGALPAPHQAWTDAITHCISNRGLPLLWRDILVDHLHGFALAYAANGTDLEGALAAYALHVDLLLDSVAIRKRNLQSK
jgi:AcrR family transcriptional regulator